MLRISGESTMVKFVELTLAESQAPILLNIKYVVGVLKETDTTTIIITGRNCRDRRWFDCQVMA